MKDNTNSLIIMENKYALALGEECNSIYMGHKALSEEETLSLSYVLNSLAQDMMAFINIRGFGRYMTVPYGNVNIQSNNHDIVVSFFYR